jgi:hypothetical protein
LVRNGQPKPQSCHASKPYSYRVSFTTNEPIEQPERAHLESDVRLSPIHDARHRNPDFSLPTIQRAAHSGIGQMTHDDILRQGHGPVEREGDAHGQGERVPVRRELRGLTDA